MFCLNNSLNDSFKTEYTTILGGEPIGLCGSGILDLISELFNNDIIDETGKLNIEVKKFYISKEVYISQKDIREFQLAKGAIYAGIKVLMDKMNIKEKNIGKLFIAGGFGNYIDIKSATNVNMIPKELEGKTIAAGNAAGTGSKIYLLSKEYIKITNEMKDKIEYVDLSSSMLFQEKFIEGMGL
ncbi:MAG: ASKHA domain-containing protein [Clostridiaceae bacterium]